MTFIPFLQTGALFQMFIPLLLVIVIFYFFLIRPQNKKQKETERMLNALKKGDKIITIGGIHGVIASVKEQTVLVKVEDGAKIEFNRSAIATVELTEAEKAKIAAAAEAKKLEKKNKKSSAEKVEAKAEPETKEDAEAETSKTEDEKSE